MFNPFIKSIKQNGLTHLLDHMHCQLIKHNWVKNVHLNALTKSNIHKTYGALIEIISKHTHTHTHFPAANSMNSLAKNSLRRCSDCVSGRGLTQAGATRKSELLA